jgi:hypothetical protein
MSIEKTTVGDNVQKIGSTFPDHMRPSLAAQYSGISMSTLAKLRMRHNRHRGPKFAKMSGCVVYRRGDLDAWLEANLV